MPGGGDIYSPTQLARKLTPPGDIRGYDVRTGKLLWTFHVVPRRGEFGHDTWLDGSAEESGNSGTWAWLSADEELGYVYVPHETASGDWYGGHRPGDNLFSESIVCLDARAGRRVWHFQAVHHGVWDYDFPAAPVLIDITVNGRRIKALAQVSKQAFTYVLDRETGTPVWPIEERPVPRGDVPGEWYAPTQPFPTKPPAYDLQGLTVDDLIDFTPELRKEAVQILDKYRHGPLFTPPSRVEEGSGTKGTILIPGIVGGTDWNGAAADPETGMLYVPSIRHPTVIGLVKSVHPRSDMPWVRQSKTGVEGSLELPNGLPITKPPYGSLVGIDLNTGDIAWRVANGDGPRDHPAIRHLKLPPLGTLGRPSPLVTKTLLFMGEGAGGVVAMIPKSGGGKMFRAFDKRTGAVVWEMALPGGTLGAPMTYLMNGKQYIVVSVGGPGMPAELIALSLP